MGRPMTIQALPRGASAASTQATAPVAPTTPGPPPAPPSTTTVDVGTDMMVGPTPYIGHTVVGAYRPQ